MNGSPTAAISGPSSAASLRSADLHTSLENRLRATTDLSGSPIYRLVWKSSDMVWGDLIFRLRASGRRTSDSGCGGWPTPMATDEEHGHAGTWSTTHVNIHNIVLGKGKQPGGEIVPAAEAVPIGLAGWPTPVANDDNKTPEAHLRMKQRMGERDGTGASRTAITSLQVMAQLAGWPTASARDWRDGRSNQHGKNARPLNEVADLARQTASGPPPSGSPAGTAKRGQLNPALSRWLMGLPMIWDLCACAISPVIKTRAKKFASSRLLSQGESIASVVSEDTETP